MRVLLSILVVFIAIILSYYSKMSVSAARAKNLTANVTSKRAVVIGGTAGIGKGIALRLAESNCSVTIVGRNAEAGESIVAEMKKKSPQQEFAFIKSDSSLLGNARPFAEMYRSASAGKPLDFIVATAGIATMQGYTPTSEGLDQKMATHYFGRYAFIKELLPLMKESQDARVLSVLSGGVHSAYEGYQTDFDLSKDYSLKKAADAAGFYNDIAVDSLSRENNSVSFIHAAPGFISTNWGTEMNWFLRGLIRGIQAIGGRSEADCGEYMVQGLLAPEYKAPGFFVMDQYGNKSKTVGDEHEKARESVWQQTLKVFAARGL